MLEALMRMSFPPRPSVDGAIGSGRQGWHGHRCCCGSAGGRGWTEFDLARGPLGVKQNMAASVGFPWRMGAFFCERVNFPPQKSHV